MSNCYLNNLNGKTWIASHSGVFGGNIPRNSIPSFQAALLEQADVIEMDLSTSLDGTLYVMHPQTEPIVIRNDKLVSQMHDDEVREQRLYNVGMIRTEWGIPLFEDVLEMLKDKCVINIDKFWTNIPGISDAIRRHGMQDQVIVKTPLESCYLSQLEEFAFDMPFMPLIYDVDGTHERLLKNPHLRYIGMEVAFKNDSHPMTDPEFINKVHDDGCILWLNTIVFDYRKQLAAYHSDDVALCGDLDASWGWAIEKGYDILQTDWPLALRLYGAKKNPERFELIK